MSNSETVVLRGELYWAKVLGDPVLNYNKDGNEWVFDLALDKNGLKQAKSIKAAGKTAFNIKNKDDERGDFLTFKQKEYRTGPDGSKIANKPIRVTDANGRSWDPDTKLGNKTKADVKVVVRDYGAGKYPGIYPQAIRILDHKPYESQDFAPLDESDEFYDPDASSGMPTDEEFRRDFGLSDDLDDDVPGLDRN